MVMQLDEFKTRLQLIFIASIIQSSPALLSFFSCARPVQHIFFFFLILLLSILCYFHAFFHEYSCIRRILLVLICRTIVAFWQFLSSCGAPKFVFQFYWGSLGAMNNLLFANILDADNHMLGELNGKK